ncbi:MAG: flagellin lysine-N-methylase [Lachnospiraceae bacterium]|nr:flagellin lysine-N-methylase [Lachnospiraceae bacterium]
MIYRKQDDFDTFRCIAGKCPESCCEAWQIYMDEESEERYKTVFGSFGERLISSIDWEAGCFLQHGRRCAMLNSENLCDLQISLGEENLCNTCKTFPRHMEEYEDVREYTLDLSCPVAARMIVQRSSPLSFTETEDETYDDPDDYEDFDDLFYDLLCASRDVLLQIARNRSLPLAVRLEAILDVARKLQACYDEDRFFDMDDVIDEASGTNADNAFEEEVPFCDAVKDFSLLRRLEVLHPDWPSTLSRTEAAILADENAWSAAMHPDRQTETAAENVLISYLFTCFCAAVYDGEIFGRARLCVSSVRSVLAITAFLRQENPSEGPMELMARALWKYTREVCHSDENLETIICRT